MKGNALWGASLERTPGPGEAPVQAEDLTKRATAAMA